MLKKSHPEKGGFFLLISMLIFICEISQFVKYCWFRKKNPLSLLALEMMYLMQPLTQIFSLFKYSLQVHTTMIMNQRIRT